VSLSSRRASAAAAAAALTPAPSHAASHPDQDSYAYGNSENEQRAVLDLARHPVQCVVADLGAVLGGLIAETRGLLTGRSDGITDVIAGRRHASRSAPTGRSPDSFKLLLKCTHAALYSGDVACKCR
jgi:hypothetical protein